MTSAAATPLRGLSRATSPASSTARSSASASPESPETGRSTAAEDVDEDYADELPAPKATKVIKVDDQDDDDGETRFQKLEALLEKSRVYSRIMKERMEQARQNMQAKSVSTPTARKPNTSARGKGKKRPRTEEEEEDDDSTEPEELPPIEQPSLITGTKLKSYQLEGLAWMASLYENGISGILADEMGLGKTLQTIAFNAFFRERSFKPFLVVCPLSVLHNWGEEFKKFAPDIPFVTYHGDKEHRAELRRTVMFPSDNIAEDVWAFGGPPHDLLRQRGEASSPSKKVGRPPKGKKPPPKNTSGKRGAAKFGRKPAKRQRTDSASEDEDEGAKPPPNTYPVILTTYEMVIRDQKFLCAYSWGFIVVDEGHRLKNFDSKLMHEIKKYESAGRMVLTGTPLQNNLAELWSLLNFVLPDIFSNLDSFQEWFNLPTVQEEMDAERTSKIMQSLHAILKPFLLRRLKVDVEKDLPPKKEYVLYAPLTSQQRVMYDAITQQQLRQLLIAGKQADHVHEPEKQKLTRQQLEAPRKTRGKKPKKSYDVDGDDDEYFDQIEANKDDHPADGPEFVNGDDEAREIGKAWTYKAALKKVNTMSLQNTVMQLRKVCSHPFLFDWPTDPRTKDLVIDDQLVNASGKMMVLERLLDELFARGHKVLIFSQFKIGLDIIEDWAVEFKGWPICRIDGETDAVQRREEMHRFQTGGDAPNAPRLFLLTTRAGGQGINLTAADTVIFYDQDWNPQMDAQAADRAHRIGQTRPVLIFRLVSKHTIEARIMQRAAAKRQLEALVIAKGKFRAPTAATSTKATAAEAAAALLELEAERIEVVPDNEAGKASVLSDEDLNALLDRSPEVYAGRGKGWTQAKDAGTKGDAFAVFETPVESGNAALANMLEEELPS